MRIPPRNGHGTIAGYRRHHRMGTPTCADCRRANQERRRAAAVKSAKDGIGAGARAGACDLWPGITQGLDSRCSCTRAFMGAVYQVKVRNAMCLNHGGTLAGVLARMARWPATYA